MAHPVSCKPSSHCCVFGFRVTPDKSHNGAKSGIHPKPIQFADHDIIARHISAKQHDAE
jgi:hypothetical protein